MTETKYGDAYVPVQKIYNLTDHWFPDKIGGSCVYAHKLHRLLSKQVETETVTLVSDTSRHEQHMVVHKVLHKAGFLHNRKEIKKLARGTDAIWVVHSPWFFLHLFFALGFKVRDRVIGVYHGPWFHEYFISAAGARNIVARLAYTLLRYVVELFYSIYVKRFIFLSSNMYRATSRYLPIAKSKVHIIPMWSEKERWDHPTPKHGSFLLSTFRRLEPRMGLQDLLVALKRCDVEQYSLIICGDGPYRNELDQLIERLDLRDRVELRGWVSEEEKAKLIRESSAVVIPSRSLEGFSLLALEALESGTPVLVTEAVGFYEYVRDLEQDFVKKIDLEDSKVEMQAFLALGRARSGLDRMARIFDADKIGQAILGVISPDGERRVKPRLTSATSVALQRKAVPDDKQKGLECEPA